MSHYVLLLRDHTTTHARKYTRGEINIMLERDPNLFDTYDVFELHNVSTVDVPVTTYKRELA